MSIDKSLEVVQMRDSLRGSKDCVQLFNLSSASIFKLHFGVDSEGQTRYLHSKYFNPQLITWLGSVQEVREEVAASPGGLAHSSCQ